jgi:hypothetical protein
MVDLFYKYFCQNMERKVQKFLYRGEEFSYRLTKASFRRYEKETGNTVERALSGRPDDTIMLLYFCVCWVLREVSLSDFMHHYKTGGIRFSAFYHHYSFWGLRGLFRSFYRSLKF